MQSSIFEDFNQPGKATVLIDGQYGSTGKGLIAAYIAQHSPVDFAVTNASANAGHTTILPDGTTFVTFHMPTAGIINRDAVIYLNAGAIIDPEILMKEIEEFKIEPGRLVIHPNAAVITQEDKDYEKSKTSGATKIASTQKGVGRALARKVMREGVVVKNHPMLRQYTQILNLNRELSRGKRVMVEVPQGFSLGNDQPWYPNTTSRIVSPGQGLSDAGISPRFIGNIIMTNRTYPIRVGNIVQDGEQLGYSGDCYDDQREVTWEELGQKAEVTTVTKRVRRIFTFSRKQYRDSLDCIRPTHVFLNFVNYLQAPDDLFTMLSTMGAQERETGVIPQKVFGLGPSTTDVVETLEQASAWLHSKRRAAAE